MAAPHLVSPEYGAWPLWLSWAAIVWERLWRALWPASASLGLFVLVALLDILPFLPSWLHGLVLVGTVSGLIWLFKRGVRDIELPRSLEARRRLERINELLHRPLEAIEDTLSGEGASDEARALWREHQRRMRGMLKGLIVGLPAPHLAARDPHALRIVLAVMLFTVGAATVGDGWSRISRAITPQFAFLTPAAPAVLDAWITPPEYTSHPPLFLSAADGVGGTHGEYVEVPAGSKLVVQVSGGSGEPRVVIGDQEQEVARVEEHNYKGLFVLDKTGSLTVSQGRSILGTWQVVVIPDLPPTIEFAQEPTSTPRGVLQIEFSGADDYGIDSVTATIRRLDRPESAEVIDLELPLPSARPHVVSGMGFFDLTPHRWAGLDVAYQLVVTDGIGQTSVSEVLTAVMPTRRFDHPVARAIIAQRSLLTRDSSVNRQRAASGLDIIARQPNRYADDMVVFLALTSAQRRLSHDRADTAIAEVQQLLWDTALRVEDGRLSIAARDLRQAENDLLDAMASDASDQELERLMAELEAALNEFLDELMAALQNKDTATVDENLLDPNANMIDRQELRDLLNQIRELARSGAKDAARQLLSQLQQLIEELRSGQFARAEPNSASQAMRTLNDLQRLIQGQHELLDRTFREAQGGQSGQQGERQPGQQGQRGQQGQQGQQGGQGQTRRGNGKAGDMSGEAVLQEALRRQLGDIMRRISEISGEIPLPFGRAERAMRNSTDALQGSNPAAAVGPQSEALDQLQQAARDATAQLMQQLGQRRGNGQRQGTVRAGTPRDPFGRSVTPGYRGMDQGDVDIPTESDVQRARKILDELRRRAAQRSRPQLEQDYIDRLLHQF
jgi:uncharacterized protein (TIGR02302 family)